MCDPVSIGVASLALTAASTGMSFIGQMNQQAAMGAQANYMRQQADQQRQVADWQAKDAISRGKVAEDAQRHKTQQAIGNQTAQLAGQGTDLEGSPTDILGDTAAAGELDALTVRNNAEREAYGYKVAGVNATSQANLQAARASSGSSLGAGASLLAGASTLGEKWWRFQQNGALGGGGSGGTAP
jgi:hypothetical protein